VKIDRQFIGEDDRQDRRQYGSCRDGFGLHTADLTGAEREMKAE
jgi:hypothetical protein